MFYVAAMSGSHSGDDDVFLIIRAESIEEAIAFADSEFAHFPNYSRETHGAYSIQELTDLPKDAEESTYLVHGPLYGTNIFRGRGRFLYRDSRDTPWIDANAPKA